jgi:branched-chain amino acid transport system permease protein
MRWLGLREAVALTLLGVLAAAGAAALLGLLIARYRGIFFAMLNMAISMVVYALLLKLYWLTGGTDGIGIRTPTILGFAPGREALRLVVYYFTLALDAPRLLRGLQPLDLPLGCTCSAPSGTTRSASRDGDRRPPVIYAATSSPGRWPD